MPFVCHYKRAWGYCKSKDIRHEFHGLTLKEKNKFTPPDLSSNFINLYSKPPAMPVWLYKAIPSNKSQRSKEDSDAVSGQGCTRLQERISASIGE